MQHVGLPISDSLTHLLLNYTREIYLVQVILEVDIQPCIIN